MTQTLTVNTARSNLYTSLVASVPQPYTPKQFPKLVFGETIDVELYLTDAARSGVAGFTPRIVITLDDQKPSAGTFTISAITPDIFTIYGAGDESANGEYVDTGETYNGGKVYHLNGTFFYYNFDGVWKISKKASPTGGSLGDWYSSSNTDASKPEDTRFLTFGDLYAPAPLISNGDTTAALDWDATETEIEIALNSLNDGAGPFFDKVTVDKYANGSFNVFFDTVGDRATLTVAASGVQPVSTASILPIVEGDATTREQQLIQIKASPLVFSEGGTLITDGWRMTLDTNNANFLQATAREAISANYSIEIVNASSEVDVIARGPVILEPATFNVA